MRAATTGSAHLQEYVGLMRCRIADRLHTAAGSVTIDGVIALNRRGGDALAR
jgi:hypothetical protein